MKATELVSKFARGMKEQLLKTSGADVLSSGKKTQKNLREGWHPFTPPPPPPTHPPLVLLRVNLHGLVHDMKHRKHFYWLTECKNCEFVYDLYFE